VKEKEARLKAVEERIEQALLNVPNLPHETVPVGAPNATIRWSGLGDKPEIRRPKEHTEIGERLGLLDFERAAKVSGARFAFYRGPWPAWSSRSCSSSSTPLASAATWSCCRLIS